VAKSQFDFSLLKPVESNKSKFDTSKLKPINEEDEGTYLDSLPQSEGFLNKIPRNILIGLTNMGKSLHNTPHDVVQGIENVGDTFANGIHFPGPEIKMKNERRLSSYLPNDTADYAPAFGQKGEGTLMDKLIQKGVEYAPEIALGGGLLRGGFRRLKGTHQLDELRNSLNENGFRQFNYPQEITQEARTYLPQSRATNEMIHQMESGNFNPAFSMQSQVGHHQRNFARSPLASERLMAPRAGELKQSMIGHLENVLRSEGMDREANLLRSGINNYRVYSQVKNAVMPVFKKLGIPVTALSALGFGLNKAKQLLRD
jgi:hypothetical protein